MLRLKREHKVFQFSHRDQPALEVDPGEAILVETTDSFDAQFDRSELKSIDVGTSAEDTSIDLERALPMTGPIAVRGAELGDVLVAELLGIVATSNAFVSVLPGFSDLLLGEHIPPEERWTVRIVELARGKVHFAEDLELPYHFMVGSLGVAPAGEPVKTAPPGDHGGNHDCIHFDVGSRLYLRVQVPGALVSLGDVHAAMGDGEGAGTGVECDAEVKVRFHLLKGRGDDLPGPVLETPTALMVYGHGETTDDAIAMAKHRTIELLGKRRGLRFADAYMLLAAVGHIRLNELVNPSRSARVEIPRYILDRPL